MSSVHLRLSEMSPEGLQSLCGAGNRVLHRIESHFDVHLLGQPGNWHIEGTQAAEAAEALRALARKAANSSIEDVFLEGLLRDAQSMPAREAIEKSDKPALQAGRRKISAKTRNQHHYLQTIHNCVLTLAVGPAGTGKTYLAVAAAVMALQANQVERIILTRPAVEAGERLGFLPGDMQQKVDPYLRPLFDALSDMVGLTQMTAYLEAGRIEVAPLAYMRGRTLNDSFVILDEAQNTTRAQMKMFLTRLGFASRMVVTGDITQIDLSDQGDSGLLHTLHVLEGVKDVGICRMTGNDVVRHPLVERIVTAYERAEAGNGD
ncbi:MAG: PhoH family protein [Mariprofundaceae bacterium]